MLSAFRRGHQRGELNGPPMPTATRPQWSVRTMWTHEEEPGDHLTWTRIPIRRASTG